MTRSPLFYPLNRGLDGDAGGVSDLQTDVMRFMAILALCLVAVFALVQSIPLAPQQETPAPVESPEPAAQEAASATLVAAVKPDAASEREIVLTRPLPEKLPHEDAPPVLQRPRAAVVEKTEALPVRPAPPREGFTLRFEDNVALTRLVARNEVGLYAILPDKSYRMNVNRGQFSFWPASMPKRFHEMDDTTVPAAVTDAFRLSGAPRSRGIKWGVTIPPTTSSQLEKILREETGGDLVIDADGTLRLE